MILISSALFIVLPILAKVHFGFVFAIRGLQGFVEVGNSMSLPKCFFIVIIYCLRFVVLAKVHFGFVFATRRLRGLEEVGIIQRNYLSVSSQL